MNKQPPEHAKSMDDSVLHYVLKRHDPSVPPSQVSLAALEEEIFAKIDDMTCDRVLYVPVESHMTVGTLSQGWIARLAAFASVLIIVSGFFIGQFSYGEADIASPTGAPALLAFADEPLMHYLPAADVSQGDNNEDAQ